MSDSEFSPSMLTNEEKEGHYGIAGLEWFTRVNESAIPRWSSIWISLKSITQRSDIMDRPYLNLGFDTVIKSMLFIV